MNFYAKYRTCLKKIQITEKSLEIESEEETFISYGDSRIEKLNNEECEKYTAENSSCLYDNQKIPINNVSGKSELFDYSSIDYENSIKSHYIVLHPSIKQISELLNKKPFDDSLPAITLSMAKILTNAAISTSIRIIEKSIFIVKFYLKQSYKAYISHRKEIIQDIIMMAPL